MRIALLIETDAPGGAERMVAQLATELDRRGHDVIVFVPPRGEGWIARQLEGTDVKLDHFWLARPVDPGCARELAGSLAQHEMDIAHGHEFTMAFYGAWASRLAGIPHVITMHGRGHYAGALRRRIALRAAAASSGATVAVSQALADQLAHDLLLSRRRITFIPNGVRLAGASTGSLREELGLRPGQRLAVCVGSLYPVKGHRHLLRAVAALPDSYRDLHVAIAGQGQLKDELSALASTLGIAGRVHLLGPRADVAAVLAAGDVFVHPSLAEGLPLALLEAMSAGRPIIASDVGEIGAVLAGGEAGVLVEAGNEEMLGTALRGLLDDPARAARLGQAALRRVNAEYRLERMVARYEALYVSLVKPVGLTGAPLLATAASPG